VYPLLHVGVHELPLARLPVHGVASPFAIAIVASHALALQANVLLNVPAKHDLLPDAVYPLLHVGVHELPLARLAVQSPSAPFVVAAVASHALALHTAVSVVSVPAAQVLVPETVYPLLHVGVHELPLARLPVHGVASPLVGTAAASHALHKELH
jgi:hypothetical protein